VKSYDIELVSLCQFIVSFIRIDCKFMLCYISNIAGQLNYTL